MRPWRRLRGVRRRGVRRRGSNLFLCKIGKGSICNLSSGYIYCKPLANRRPGQQMKSHKPGLFFVSSKTQDARLTIAIRYYHWPLDCRLTRATDVLQLTINAVDATTCCLWHETVQVDLRLAQYFRRHTTRGSWSLIELVFIIRVWCGFVTYEWQPNSSTLLL